MGAVQVGASGGIFGVIGALLAFLWCAITLWIAVSALCTRLITLPSSP